MDVDRLEWINNGQEAPVDSTQRIIDPHHHLWERGGSRYRAEELSQDTACLLYTSPSPRDATLSRMPSSA